MTIEMLGREFGRLRVVEFAGLKNNQRLWKVACACGAEKVVVGSNLRRGITTSCGCLHKEMLRARLTKGHDTTAPEYRTWSHLRERCTNPKNKDYASYGGRGIGYPKEWDDYPAFLADVGPRPFQKAEIERIHNDQDYSKSNCRWATRKEQNRNKRNTLWVLLCGQKMSLAEASERTGANYGTLRSRIVRGHPIGHNITLPKKEYQ